MEPVGVVFAAVAWACVQSIAVRLTPVRWRSRLTGTWYHRWIEKSRHTVDPNIGEKKCDLVRNKSRPKAMNKPPLKYFLCTEKSSISTEPRMRGPRIWQTCISNLQNLIIKVCLFRAAKLFGKEASMITNWPVSYFCWRTTAIILLTVDSTYPLTTFLKFSTLK